MVLTKQCSKSLYRRDVNNDEQPYVQTVNCTPCGRDKYFVLSAMAESATCCHPPPLAAKNSDEDLNLDDVIGLTVYEVASDTETSEDEPQQQPDVKRKRGRKPLTPQEKELSLILRKAYFQKYYKEHPEKYPYEKHGFENSCIYKLSCSNSDKVYIGSTILPLEMRKKRHMTCIKTRKNMTYSEMSNASNNAKDWTIEAILKVPLENKKQLDALESIYISSCETPLFNKKGKYSMEIVMELSKLLPTNLLPKQVQDLIQVPEVKNKNI